MVARSDMIGLVQQLQSFVPQSWLKVLHVAYVSHLCDQDSFAVASFLFVPLLYLFPTLTFYHFHEHCQRSIAGPFAGASVSVAQLIQMTLFIFTPMIFHKTVVVIIA